MKNLKHSVYFILLLTLVGCNEATNHKEKVQIKSSSIMNGTIDQNREYQSTIKLIGRDGSCSGVVIHPRLVVSSATCADRNLYAVAARDLTEGVEFFKSSKIMKVISHEEYNVDGAHKNNIALFILEDRIFLKEYPFIVEDIYDFDSLLRKSNGQITSVGFGIDENNDVNYDRRFAKANYMEDYGVCGDSNIDQDEIISSQVTNSGDSGGGIYTTYKDRKYLLGINHGTKTLQIDSAECKYSQGYKLYRYKRWFRELGFDIFSNDKELLNEQIHNHLREEEVVSDNLQNSSANEEIPTYGENIGVKINRAIILRAQEESAGLKMMFSYCNDRGCALKSGYQSSILVGRKFQFKGIIPLLSLDELQDMYDKHNVTRVQVDLYNEQMSYGKFYIDIEELINQRVTVKTEAFFDMLYMDTELVLYDK